MTFSAKLDPREKVTFHLRYEELLQRYSSTGKYKYEVNIQPKYQKIPDFLMKVYINESLPLEEITVQRIKDKNEALFQAEDITQVVLNYDQDMPNFAEISISPNRNGRFEKFVFRKSLKRVAQES